MTVALASTGTAVLGSDFDLASSQLAVAQGSTRALTTVTPIRDLEAETETIRLEIEALGGRGEIGSPSSVRIAVRDRGAPQAKLDYAALEAFLLIHRLEEDAVSFVVYVTNIGDVAASSTRAVLYTTTDDLFSSSPDLAGLEVLAGARPGAGWLVAQRPDLGFLQGSGPRQKQLLLYSAPGRLRERTRPWSAAARWITLPFF